MRKAQLGSVSERLADDGTAKCPESLCPMSALPPSGRRVPPPLRALPLIHRSYGLMRPSPLALLSFGLSLVRGVFAGCDQPLLPAGCSRRYLCESFFRCLIPCHGGPTKCIYLFLPSCHRPPPEVEWVGFPLLTANTTFRGPAFRGCRYSIMFRPPNLLVSQIVPTAARTATGRPRLLHPGRTCFVTSARTGYTNRPNTGN